MLSKTLKNFSDGFSRHDLMTLSAALAFYSSLSLAPLLLLMVAGVSFLGAGGQEQFMKQVESLVGPQASLGVAMIINNVEQRETMGSYAGLIGIATLLFSASGVFAQLQTSLNVIHETAAPTDGSTIWRFLRRRLLSIGLVVAFTFLAVVSLVVSALMAAMLPRGDIWKIVNDLVTLLVFAGLFTAIFKLVPDRRPPWRQSAVSGTFTALLFTLGKIVIGLYLGKSALGSAYGAAGSVIVLLAWVYYSSLIVFVGAELTRAFIKAR
jgi:membrane protein